MAGLATHLELVLGLHLVMHRKTIHCHLIHTLVHVLAMLLMHHTFIHVRLKITLRKVVCSWYVLFILAMLSMRHTMLILLLMLSLYIRHDITTWFIHLVVILIVHFLVIPIHCLLLIPLIFWVVQ